MDKLDEIAEYFIEYPGSFSAEEVATVRALIAVVRAADAWMARPFVNEINEYKFRRAQLEQSP